MGRVSGIRRLRQDETGRAMRGDGKIVCGVRPEYGLLRGDQRTKRATRPPEEGTVSNLCEIAEAFKLEYGVGGRASAQLRLGPSAKLRIDSVEWIRMTMGEGTERGRWIPTAVLGCFLRECENVLIRPHV